MAATITECTDPLADMATERLEAELVSLIHRINHDTAQLLRLIGEFDHRGTWARFGALSCATWLAGSCDLDIGTARTHLRVARSMRQHPDLADAIICGSISYAKARVLVPHLTAGNSTELIALAESHPASRLGIAIADWSRQHESDHDRDERHHRERRLSWRTDPDGMITLTARLPPAEAARIIARIDHTVISTPKRQRNEATPGASSADAYDRRREPRTASAGARTSNRENPSVGASPGTATTRATASPDPRGPVGQRADRGDHDGSNPQELTARGHRTSPGGIDAPAGAFVFPSLAQQRADALVHLTSGSEVGHTRSSEAPAVTSELVIHVRGDRNTLADGTPIADHAVTRLLPAAFISLLITDAKRNPIDASPRRRTPTRRQRRVVDGRNPTCSHPGCEARIFLQYDHIEPYAQGGPTTLENLRRLCGPHNRARNP